MSESLRPDLRVIADFIEPKARVLDIGCGEAVLLAWLAEHKQVDGRGIEIDQTRVQRAIAKGVPVVQGDVSIDLVDYPDNAYDYVILSQTLQTMQDPSKTLRELIRIGKRVVVSVPNFGHWKNRFYLALYGKMPVTKTLRHSWYDTPNIHFCTITDFIVLCEALGIRIVAREVVDARGYRSGFQGRGFWANLFGEQGVFLLEKR